MEPVPSAASLPPPPQSRAPPAGGNEQRPDCDEPQRSKAWTQRPLWRWAGAFEGRVPAPHGGGTVGRARAAGTNAGRGRGDRRVLRRSLLPRSPSRIAAHVQADALLWLSPVRKLRPSWGGPPTRRRAPRCAAPARSPAAARRHAARSPSCAAGGGSAPGALWPSLGLSRLGAERVQQAAARQAISAPVTCCDPGFYDRLPCCMAMRVATPLSPIRCTRDGEWKVPSGAPGWPLRDAPADEAPIPLPCCSLAHASRRIRAAREEMDGESAHP